MRVHSFFSNNKKTTKIMNITLKRIAKQANYTIGQLYVDGEYLCDTLEPKYRDPKKEKKVPGRTAIPAGTYRILITKSYRFRRWLPLLMDVPQFQGIRIHAGNYPQDTQGCILVGWNRKRGMVVNSRSALQQLMLRLTAAQERDEALWITIE